MSDHKTSLFDKEVELLDSEFDDDRSGEQHFPAIEDLVKNHFVDRKDNGLTLDEFKELCEGCGCCRRHSQGVYPRSAVHSLGFHNWNWENTVYKRDCECSCRHWLRKVLTVEDELELEEPEHTDNNF